MAKIFYSLALLLAVCTVAIQAQGQQTPAAGALPADEEYYYDDTEEPAAPAAAAPAPPPPPPAPVSPPVGSRTAQRQSPISSGRQSLSTLRGRGPQAAAQTPAPAAPAPTRLPVTPAPAPAASVGVAASTSQTAPQQNEFFDCPEKNGFFAHDRSCDKYWKCDEGVSTLKICGNGLVFDDTDLKRESCNYPFTVDCGLRSELEPPQSSQNCPRLYGIFSDQADCRIFWSCWGGEAKKYECSPGLAFDETHRVCTWADTVSRCLKTEVAEGFTCPEATSADQAGAYTRHGHPDDCRKFFVCISTTPRMYGCELGTVFNLDTLQCDDPANVAGCEDYYGDLDIKTLKKAQASGFGGGSGAAPKKPTPKVAPAEETAV
jgi:hypothetical protein